MELLALQAEAFSWHRNQLRDRWLDYGRPTRLTIAKGALISAGDLVQIERVREIARKQLANRMQELGVDLLVSPTTGYAATPSLEQTKSYLLGRNAHPSLELDRLTSTFGAYGL